MATAKKPTVKKRTVKKPRKTTVQSFKLNKETVPFVTYKITEQTVYWSILLILILVLALWVLQIPVNSSDMLSNLNIT